MDITDAMRSDLGNKCADDVMGAIKRTTALLNSTQDRFLISLYGTAAATGLTAGFAQQILSSETPEQAVDDLWTILRPIVLSVAAGQHADFRALLRQAPKDDGTFSRKRRRHPHA